MGTPGNKRVQIKSLDFIRAVCAIGIVLFHFSWNFFEYGIGGDHLVFAQFANGNWGGMFVAMFFMISGALLWHIYGSKISVWRFYVKRWLSIFPMFYLAWAIVYVYKVQTVYNGVCLWAGPKRLLLYTVFGVDGYFMQLDPTKPGFLVNYYMLGEWFLGAIVMLYVLFPLLRLLFKNKWSRYIFTLLLAAAYCWNLYSDYFTISDGTNMITCVMNFWAGMLIMEYWGRRLLDRESPSAAKTRRVTIAAALLGILIMCLPVSDLISACPGLAEQLSAWPVNLYIFHWEVLVSTLAGACWILVFMDLGEKIMRIGFLNKIFSAISRYSFGIFLVHHVLIYELMEQFKGQTMSLAVSWLAFILVFAIICLVGALLSAWGSFVSRLVLRLLPDGRTLAK